MTTANAIVSITNRESPLVQRTDIVSKTITAIKQEAKNKANKALPSFFISIPKAVIRRQTQVRARGHVFAVYVEAPVFRPRACDEEGKGVRSYFRNTVVHESVQHVQCRCVVFFMIQGAREQRWVADLSIPTPQH